MFPNNPVPLEPGRLDDLNLSAYLEGLVARFGCRGTAAELGVAYSTVSRWQSRGVLSKTLRLALERRIVFDGSALRDGNDERLEALADSVSKLREAFECLSERDRDIREALSAITTRLDDLEREVKRTRLEVGQLRSMGEERHGFGESGQDRPAQGVRAVPQRTEVSQAGPNRHALVDRWQFASHALETAGTKLAAARARRHLLEVEIELLERPGTSIPPGENWDYFRRRQALEWRWSALRNQHREIAKRRALVWFRRMMTFGIWWK